MTAQARRGPASTEGRARVAAAQRRIEVRIGQLLGPTEPGQRHDLEPSRMGEGSDDRVAQLKFRAGGAKPERFPEPA